MTTQDVVIVGGGLAALHVATNLRAAHFTGSIRVLSAESELPYDRTPLSKAFMRGEVDEVSLQLKPQQFFASENFEWHLGERVTEVDAAAQQVTTSTGSRFAYDQLVWAAGGSPRALSIEGSDLDGVVHVRTLEDAQVLRRRAQSARSMAVIGGGHIGLEVAAAMRHMGLDVAVLEAQDRLLARVTSPVVSDYYARLHTDAGVKIITSAVVERIEGRSGVVSSVELADGTSIPADIVVVGVGIIPEVEPLRAAGAVCSNGVDVDASCSTSLPNVFALGDCANMERHFASGRQLRLESVPNVTAQAKVVARSLMGEEASVHEIPWFWSHQYETKLRTVGVLGAYDELVVRGEPATGQFSVAYLKDSQIVAMDCVNRMKDFVRAKELVGSQQHVEAAAVAAVEDLRELLTPTT
ncbi:NAD(P)/FAD-dependent oxidoreductase [Agrococcus baldri]|uniref:Pyridine nucleotide-disulfide oxidoreductase n=1 Tax=Agrococcus baldri TaxID=153730 RepID=A0AA87RAK5_9MICO|nr:FAD-dependent oxidoreductase [Agrococcus baldri]GEK79147.1 pyridine nucleotide-disulfide oxidoreductase [Agrococcus baldri]